MIDKLKPINQFLGSLGKKEFERYAAIYIGFVFVLASFLIYLNYKSINGRDGLNAKIKSVNIQREEIQDILTLNKEVERQKNIVDHTLKKRSFKLQHYFEDTINKLGLKRNLQKHAAFVSNLESLRSQGYSEVRVEANLVNLNTKQLVELLNEIEKAGVIYTKILEITASRSQLIDVAITIATLQIDKDKATG